MKPRLVPLLAAVAAVACGAADTPEAQAARGAEVYDRECRHCHDVEGAIGVALSGRVIASYGTAQRLFNYLRVAMPYGAPGSRAEGEYWDLVAFLASDRVGRAVPLLGDTVAAAGVELTGDGESR